MRTSCHLAFVVSLAMLLALAASGCATTKALEQANADLAACQTDKDRCAQDLASCKSKLAQADSAKALAERRMQAYRAIAEKLRAAFGDMDIDIIIRNGRLIVQLPNRILFDSGRHTLRAEAQDTIQKLASVLTTVPGRQFLIAGHTDNVPVKEKNTEYKTNWQLSTLRALAVVYALEAEGVASAQMGATGYGEFHPDATNDTDEGKQENRRTEIIIMPTIDEIPELPESL